MRSGGNNFNYFTENQLTTFSAATAGLLVNFGHTLSVGLLVPPWPYRPYRRRRPCTVSQNVVHQARWVTLSILNGFLNLVQWQTLWKICN